MADDGDDFETPVRDGLLLRDAETIEAETLMVALAGFEGPLDMLLALARAQKVDLRKISVLALAEQYLAFMAAARELRIELAADYLVMAAWLAYLKSRLLLPPPEVEEGPSGEELAARLALRLERLEAVRRAGAELMARDRLGRDVFARGMPEVLGDRRATRWTATLADLLRAYARVRTREEYTPLHVGRPAVYAYEEALRRLGDVVGRTPGWGELASYLPAAWLSDPAKRRSALASSFAAALELARRGEVEIRQAETFGPVWLRRPGGAG